MYRRKGQNRLASPERKRRPDTPPKAWTAPPATNQGLRELVEGLGVIVWEADATTWQFSFVSQHAEGLLGYSVEQWLREPSFWVNHVYPEDRERAIAIRQTAPSLAGRDQDLEYRMVAADGRLVWFRDIFHLVRNRDGVALKLRGLMVDATRRKQAEEALMASDLRLRALVEQTPAILWSTDTDLKITCALGTGLSALNLEPNQVVGMSVYEYFRTNDPKFHLRALQGESLSFEIPWMGRTYQAHLEPLRNAEGGITGCLGVALDITERKQAEEQIRSLAVTDPLTGLANYRRLLEVLESEINRSQRTGRPFAVLLLDLDDLKKINDNHGHLVGSQALCRLANVLLAHCRSIDTAARYGGDEFTLVLPETGVEAAGQVARRICERLENDGEEPSVSVSVGSAVYPQDGETIESLLGAADRALYVSKRC